MCVRGGKSLGVRNVFTVKFFIKIGKYDSKWQSWLQVKSLLASVPGFASQSWFNKQDCLRAAGCQYHFGVCFQEGLAWSQAVSSGDKIPVYRHDHRRRSLWEIFKLPLWLRHRTGSQEFLRCTEKLFQYIGCIDKSDLVRVLPTFLWWGQGFLLAGRCTAENWLIPPRKGCSSEKGARTNSTDAHRSSRTYIALAMKVGLKWWAPSGKRKE